MNRYCVGEEKRRAATPIRPRNAHGPYGVICKAPHGAYARLAEWPSGLSASANASPSENSISAECGKRKVPGRADRCRCQPFEAPLRFPTAVDSLTQYQKRLSKDDVQRRYNAACGKPSHQYEHIYLGSETTGYAHHDNSP